MTLSKELLTKIIKKVNGDPDSAADLIKSAESIQERIEDRRKKMARIQREADTEINQLMGEKICSHEFIRTYTDPSGGSDRTCQCMICYEYIYETKVRFT